MTGAREQYIHTNGVRLWTAKSGSGPPLLLCHGGPGLYDYLGPVAKLVDDVATVYRYDQRGCGRSEAVPPYAVATFVEDMEGLRRDWGLTRWVVGGHSWGADLALAYALTHSDRVTGLVCISGTGLITARLEHFERSRSANLPTWEHRRLTELEQLRKTAMGLELDSVRRERARLLQRAELHEPSSVHTPPSYDQLPMNHEINSMLNEDWERFAFDPDLGASVEALRVPAMVIRGEKDSRPEWALRALAERLPGGRFVSIDRAGHDPWVERPDATRRAIRTFLEDLPPEGSGA